MVGRLVLVQEIGVRAPVRQQHTKRGARAPLFVCRCAETVARKTESRVRGVKEYGVLFYERRVRGGSS